MSRMSRMSRLRGNPWGTPRVLVLITGAYIVWSLAPVLLAIRFAFNEGRSRTSTQGWSFRWFWSDPNLSVFNDPTLQEALKHSLELAAIVMVLSVPLGTALALGMRRWRGPGASVANLVMLLPLVTPELVLAVGLFLLFTTAFGFIGLGTEAQAIGQVAFTLSWVVLIVRARLQTIGPDVEEAAADLGAPPLDVVRRVLVPMLLPAMAVSLLVSFALSIDDFVVSQYLASGSDTTTVPMRIYAQARGAPTPALNALATLMLIVSLLALLLAYIVYRSLTRGETKQQRGGAIEALTAGGGA
ncbi:MAG: spermidine/putrescine transport system permease protein [Thermoleophilaceae bacterium]|nr:spermidine/putrescine transport system permease protein [Thermoleophilaceae bacterium]